MVSEREIDAAQMAFQEKYDRGCDEDELRTVLEAAARVRKEDNAGEPVAWGEDIDGKIVSVRLDKSRHCTVPLYPAPQPSGTVGAQLSPVWLQNLIGFLDGVFPDDAAWRATWLKQLRALALTAGKPEQEQIDEHRYAKRLLIALMEKHYPDRSPEWAPLPDLMGVLTQIDNLTTGLVCATPPTAGGGDD